MPVYDLLGGRVRDRIRCFGWLNIVETGDYVSQVVNGDSQYKHCDAIVYSRSNHEA